MFQIQTWALYWRPRQQRLRPGRGFLRQELVGFRGHPGGLQNRTPSHECKHMCCAHQGRYELLGHGRTSPGTMLRRYAHWSLNAAHDVEFCSETSKTEVLQMPSAIGVNLGVELCRKMWIFFIIFPKILNFYIFKNLFWVFSNFMRKWRRISKNSLKCS